MGVDNGSDRAVAELCSDEFVASASSCFGCQWVDDNPAVCPLNKGDVRNVIATYLPNAVGNFKKTVMSIELGMTPQAWVHSFRGWATSADEVVSIDIDHHAAIGIVDAARGQ